MCLSPRHFCKTVSGAECALSVYLFIVMNYPSQSQKVTIDEKKDKRLQHKQLKLRHNKAFSHKHKFQLAGVQVKRGKCPRCIFDSVHPPCPCEASFWGSFGEWLTAMPAALTPGHSSQLFLMHPHTFPGHCKTQQTCTRVSARTDTLGWRGSEQGSF